MKQMQKYREAKNKHPGMILLFHIDDFWEMYGEDAEAAARILSLCLTQRTDRDSGETIFMAAFPHHALEKHLHALLKAGHRVAICDQVDDVPSMGAAKKSQPTLFE
jgi:DNA mismatch repair protein MutS